MTGEDFYYLFSGDNRDVCNIVIHQPRVKELIKYDVDIDELIQPFFAFVDLWDVPDKYTYKNFDLIFHDHVICEKEKCPQNSMLLAMINTLRYLCRNNDIEYDMDRRTISISGIEKISRDNFDEVQSYILSIFYAKKPKPTKIIAKTEEQRQKVMRMKKKMADKRKTDLSIPTIMKIVQNGDAFISYSQILDFTYWQLMDRYSNIMKMDAYNTHMAYKLSSKYEIKDDKRTHWTEDLKVQ